MELPELSPGLDTTGKINAETAVNRLGNNRAADHVRQKPALDVRRCTSDAQDRTVGVSPIVTSAQRRLFAGA
jgi:hypothetical protein